MYRYITLLWSRTDHNAAKAADYLATRLNEISPHDWRKIWDAPGALTFTSGEHKGRMQTYRLENGGGIVLGQLFHNDYTFQAHHLDTTHSQACIKTKGQHLIDKYWGRYVAFLNDTTNGSRYVIRDPSGALPCLYTQFQGVEIYFSDMQDIANFEFLPFTINWEFLKTNILLPNLQKIYTGLNEVGEILPAQLVEITPFERKTRYLWNPTQISQNNIIEDHDEAAKALRSTVKNTVDALAGNYERIALNLGGLDSSILLACLSQTPKRSEITAITFYTESLRGDERYFSRQVAQQCRVPLTEFKLDYRKVDLRKVFEANKRVSPLGVFDCIGITGDLGSFAKEKKADALFYGTGGDNVFYQPPANLGALDYVRLHGLDRRFLKIAIEASRYGRKSLYRTLHDMLRERFAPISCFPYIYNMLFQYRKFPFENPELLIEDGLENLLHPLLLPKEDALKGKYFHMFLSALYPKEYYDYWDTTYTTSERVRPLLTQPVIETCLRIPTWIMTYGGIERGLARKAFQQDLPIDIARRVSKSGPDEYYNDIYNHNTEFIKEYLLDGVLVKKGILLRSKLEAAFSKNDPFFHLIRPRLIGHLGTEAWAKSWLERKTKQTIDLDVAI